MRGCVITNLYNIHNALLNTHYKLLCPLDQHNLINNNLCKYLLLILVINILSVFRIGTGLDCKELLMKRSDDIAIVLCTTTITIEYILNNKENSQLI